MTNFRREFLHQELTIAILGNSGREHSLAQKIAQSTFCKKILCIGSCSGFSLNPSKNWSNKIEVVTFDFSTSQSSLVPLLETNSVEFVIVDTDELLAKGVVDELQKKKILVFGPTQAAAKLEWSKVFSKEVLKAANIPTASHFVLTQNNPDLVMTWAQEQGSLPIVLKYDGLAHGRGVRICSTLEEIKDFLNLVFEEKKFSKKNTDKSNPKVLVEKFLEGHEVSLFALTDGDTYALLEPACDHKRLLENDQGPNTRGMGAYSPVPWFPTSEIKRVGDLLFPNLLSELKKRNLSFQGVLYIGLIIRGPQFHVL